MAASSTAYAALRRHHRERGRERSGDGCHIDGKAATLRRLDGQHNDDERFAIVVSDI